jgi:predicted glycoside hydrolase/deacetylase ChbG (UPF0249 family)
LEVFSVIFACFAFCTRSVHRLLLFALLASLPSWSQQQASTIQERLGYPATARLLIIHADDLGMNHSVNRAILQALEKGSVTSASVLVTCPWLPEVATWAQAHPEADLGIHLALNSEWTTLRWGPVAPKDKVASLLDPQGYMPLVEEAVVNQAKPLEVELELHSQIDRARALGIHITHLDAHMVTLMKSPALFEVYARVGRSYRLPTLIARIGDHSFPPNQPQPAFVTSSVDQVLEIGPGIPIDRWFDAYKALLTPLKPGVYELIVHLAYDDEEMRATTSNHPDWGAAWRQADLDLVSSPEFRQFLKDQGFILIDWKKLASALREQYAGGK